MFVGRLAVALGAALALRTRGRLYRAPGEHAQ